MKITRDVIIDLLPLYTSGEASADSRALVDEYLESDREFASMLREADEATNPLLRTPSATLPDSVETVALERSRRLLRRRSWAMGMAIFFTLLPFTMVHTDTIRFVMIRDEPRSAAFFVVAACLWLCYSRLNRRLAGTGL